MRLAQALHTHGHQVHLYNHYGSYTNHTNHTILKQLAPDVPVLALSTSIPGVEWLTRKVQDLLHRVGRPFPSRKRLVAKHLRQTVRNSEVELVSIAILKTNCITNAY